MNRSHIWHHDKIKVEYANTKAHRTKQEVIRDSKDPKYVEARKNANGTHQKLRREVITNKIIKKNKDKHPDDGNRRGMIRNKSF